MLQNVEMRLYFVSRSSNGFKESRLKREDPEE